MNAEVLAVGTELLMGQIANTNAQYISKRLPDVGVNVYYHSVVGDNPARLEEALKLSLSRSDAVIMTGGLGPTQDDLTKETVCKVMNKKLILHQESLDAIESFFRKLNRPMVESNKKQAYLPEGCIVMTNDRGTAPGCIIESDGKAVMMLPGPPSEMKPMFEAYVMPYFQSRCQHTLASKYLKVFGVGESSVEAKLIDMIDGQTNPTIATYAKDGEVALRITAKCGLGQDPDVILQPVVDEVKNRLGSAVYSDEDKSLEEVAGELLLKKNISISLAESCTGGLVSARLTDIPGISAVFDRGIVTYSNDAKEQSLGVKHETLEAHGAVSRETAIEMAEGVRRVSGTAIGLSITGIAGPGGGTDEKPVGLVYIALAGEKGTECKELRLWGNRTRIRNVTALYAFDMIRLYAEKL